VSASPTATAAVTAAPHPAGHRIDLTWPGARDVVVARQTGSYPQSAADGVVLGVDPAAGRFADEGLRAGETYYYMLVFAGGVVARAAATATAPHGAGAEMYDLLPALHRRFDAAQRDTPLRAFLELPGGQLDLLLSEADALRGLLDVARTDGALLPLLAAWIGWHIDHDQDHAAQRTEIRQAPALYRTTGLVAAIEATVQRVTRHPGRVKELFQNVALTNRPPRLNLWTLARERDAWGPPELLSLDGAFAGRADVAAPAGQPACLVHEQEDHGRFAICAKALRDDGRWDESAPVSDPAVAVAKGPRAAAAGSDMVVFWSELDAVSRRWSIVSRRRRPAAWAAAERVTLADDPPERERRAACAVGDGSGVWLFAHVRNAAGAPWNLCVNRHDGTRWELDRFLDVEAPVAPHDVAAAFHPTDAARPLWLFWAEQRPVTGAAPQTRWVVRFAVKTGLHAGTGDDWDDPVDVPRPDRAGEHEREPWPLVRPDGDLELYTSAFRAGRWAIWRRVIDHRTLAVSAPEPVPLPPRRARAPLAFARGDTTVLVARSSAAADARYAGATTLHTRGADARPQRGTFDDAEAYIYDCGRGDGDLYARDTLAIYVDAAAEPAARGRLRTVLDELLPATDRAVLLTDT
jgi:phage tail-like protein